METTFLATLNLGSGETWSQPLRSCCPKFRARLFRRTMATLAGLSEDAHDAVSISAVLRSVPMVREAPAPGVVVLPERGRPDGTECPGGDPHARTQAPLTHWLRSSQVLWAIVFCIADGETEARGHPVGLLKTTSNCDSQTGVCVPLQYPCCFYSDSPALPTLALSLILQFQHSSWLAIFSRELLLWGPGYPAASRRAAPGILQEAPLFASTFSQNSHLAPI